MVKTFALTFGMMLLSSLSQAKDLIVNMGGKDVTIPYQVLNREINEKDRGKGSQNSPVECSIQYYSLLAQGDIQAASKLTTDPAQDSEMMTQYRDRLGASDFRKEMESYFTSKNTILVQLNFAEETMLVVKTPEYTAGQIFTRKNGKYFMVKGRPFSEASKTLGKALTMIQEGKAGL